MMTEINIVNVPYRGPAPAFTDLISGQVQVTFGALPAAIGYIRAGELRALAVTSATRSSELPDLPAVAEFVLGYEASGWIGIGAPRGTPATIIDTLSSNITAGLADPQLKARVKDLGADPMPMTPTEFGRFMADETEKWAKVVKFSGQGGVTLIHSRAEFCPSTGPMTGIGQTRRVGKQTARLRGRASYCLTDAGS